VNRRRFVGLLGAAGAVLALGPGWALASESSHDLAVRGQDLLAAGQTDQALEVLLRARDMDPRNSRVFALLGRTYFQRGEARLALAAFRMAIRLNPEDTLSRMMVETIELFPLPLQAAAARSASDPSGRDRPGNGRLSALEREAQAERALIKEKGRAARSAGPFRLLLDPGHGGSDPGAAGPGLREADVTLDLSLRLARVLAGYRDEVAVSLTRVADAGLPGWARAGLAGYYGADWFVSLHATRVVEARASGIGVLALDAKTSDPVAAAVARVENEAHGREAPDGGRGGETIFLRAVRQAAASGLERRGVDMAGRFLKALPKTSPLPPRPLATAPLRLLAEADTPAMLVEAGFLSNPSDAASLGSADARGAVAQALAQAVLAVVQAGTAAGPGGD
jgi:N-acetylmuramoyl-L-alanine amidase